MTLCYWCQGTMTEDTWFATMGGKLAFHVECHPKWIERWVKRLGQANGDAE